MQPTQPMAKDYKRRCHLKSVNPILGLNLAWYISTKGCFQWKSKLMRTPCVYCSTSQCDICLQAPCTACQPGFCQCKKTWQSQAVFLIFCLAHYPFKAKHWHQKAERFAQCVLSMKTSILLKQHCFLPQCPQVQPARNQHRACQLGKSVCPLFT